MASLPDTLRRRLEKTVVEAREVAEAGAGAAVERLAVSRSEAFAEMAPAERELRVQLRAHARQLGDPRKDNGEQAIQRLVVECAYEHWHRMLFARFLAENRLLIHPEHAVPVTLAECEELAAQAGEKDGWRLAGRFAARMLPAIFRPDDPVLSVRLAPEHQQTLEAFLAGLPAEVFTADDSLGWVYQFWQIKQKDVVNQSEKKVGADELPAVTQFFTEPYMVHFLLHNTLGAWWAVRHPNERTPVELEFLRRREDGTPAAGTFSVWPSQARELRVLDPCCGSGHFLVAAFRVLVPFRMAEEAVSAGEACDAVLRENLYGLELDERCTQIAAFALALAAWTYPDAGGYRPLPELHVACSGLSVGAKEEDWLRFAGHDTKLREGMRRLHRLFRDAPTLGSLIDPARTEGDVITADFAELAPLLGAALQRERTKQDAVVTELGITAQGLSRSAELLASRFHLIVTNVPYLAKGKHDKTLREFCEHWYERSRHDLATVFVERCLELCQKGGVAALVTPQDWLFLTSYKELREHLLKERTWLLVATLGPAAFRQMDWWAKNVALVVLARAVPTSESHLAGVDASSTKVIAEKAELLRAGEVVIREQGEQLRNPDHRIVLAKMEAGELLGKHAEALAGIQSGDYSRFGRYFWEMPRLLSGWIFQQSTVRETLDCGGREHVLWWEEGQGALARSETAYIRGTDAWGKQGVAVSQMRHLPVTRYTGEAWDNNTAVIVPHKPRDLPAIWAFCSSPDFREAVRKIDQKVNVTNATFVKVPFDLARWQRVADERFRGGLPEPHSLDPTQWVFRGHIAPSAAPLQVAVARLLGFRWPEQTDDGSERFVDEDGIVCLPSVGGEAPASARLAEILVKSHGREWKPGTMDKLLSGVGFGGKSLEEWLRDGFFTQHCDLFYQAPFIWHIWDGRRRDGFAALVNYHRLDRKLLERLTYSILGDWVARQRQGAKADEPGSDERLVAAEKLQRKFALILEGESPHDVFVRWRPLHEQPIGWEPDLNDGVRMNIRPFVEAGVLRKNAKTQWTKDRGKEPESLRPKNQFPWFWKDGQFTGERVNDVHLTNADKRAARERAGGARPC